MALSEAKCGRFSAVSQHAMAAFSAVGTVLTLGWILKYCHYGFDFTDESFYLVWISNPFIYRASITQFGFIYHPLSLLVGGDIAALRQANVIITFGLAWALVLTLLIVLDPKVERRTYALYTVSAGLATSALIVFNSWLMTPSYNSLALQSLLIAGIGALLVDKGVHLRSIAGWAITGVGGWLAFMAKPSTAIALAVGVVIYVVLSKKFSLRLLILSVAIAAVLTLLSALFIDGSIPVFIRRLEFGLELSNEVEAPWTHL